MFRWFSYLVIVSFVLIPAALLDGVIGHIESTGWQFGVRFLFLLLALHIMRLIPSPSN